MNNKQKECYWDKSIDMSKATLQMDGKVICKFDNDNQTIIVNEGFKTPRELELEARVKELEEKLEIAKEALQYYAELYIDTDICDDQFFGYDAQQDLQKMEEVDATNRQ